MNPFFAPAPCGKTSSARSITGAQEFLHSKNILSAMYRNHIRREDFQVALLQIQRWG